MAIFPTSSFDHSGFERVFTIVAYDALQRRRTAGGDPFVVTASTTSPPNVLDKGNGTYTVIYQTEDAVSVTLSGVHIKGSPFSIRKSSSIAIGIDFGARSMLLSELLCHVRTDSRVAVFCEGKAELLADDSNSCVIPSCSCFDCSLSHCTSDVAITDRGTFVGEAAKQLSSELPKNVLSPKQFRTRVRSLLIMILYSIPTLRRDPFKASRLQLRERRQRRRDPDATGN